MVSWLIFFGVIFAMIIIDLGLLHRGKHALTIKTSVMWSCIWIGLAVAFCGYIYASQGSKQAVDFMTGYIIEKTLSLDNLLVFIVVFKTFQLTIKDQHRVLLWGILGAIVLRGIFIGFGTALVSQLHWLLYVFGIFLVYTAFKIAVQKGKPLDFKQTWIYRFVSNDKYSVPPFFLALVSIEFLDVIFAIDSIPAIFAITLDPFIVYTSNIFAILGLRAHYFLLLHSTKYEYLTDSLAYILGFAGIKILIADFIEIPGFLSLIIILGIILISFLMRRYKVPILDDKKQGHDRQENKSSDNNPNITK